MMRRAFIWGALLCTLVACWWVGQAGPSSPVETVKPTRSVLLPQAKQAQVMQAQAVPLSSPLPSPVAPVLAEDGEAGVNLFAALEVPALAMEDAQALLPVNPYQYAGRLLEDGRWTVFLTDGQEQYTLQEGDRFAGDWQVAALDQQKIVLQHAAERFEIRLDDGVVF